MQVRAAPARWLLVILLAALLATSLGGCGYKGPLYLPDETNAPKKT